MKTINGKISKDLELEANRILKTNQKIKQIEKLKSEIEEDYEPSFFKGKTEAEKANIFWKHALKVLNNR